MNWGFLKLFQQVFFIVAEESFSLRLYTLGLLPFNVLADLRVFPLLIRRWLEEEIGHNWLIAAKDLTNFECSALFVLLLQICKRSFQSDLKTLEDEFFMAEGIANKCLDIVFDIGDYVFGREKSQSCEIVIFQHFAQSLIY